MSTVRSAPSLEIAFNDLYEIAAKKDELRMKMIMDHVSINLQSKEGQTIAYLFALENNEEVVKFLLEFVTRYCPQDRLKLLQDLIRGYEAKNKGDITDKAEEIAELGSNPSEAEALNDFLSSIWFRRCIQSQVPVMNKSDLKDQKDVKVGETQSLKTVLAHHINKGEIQKILDILNYNIPSALVGLTFMNLAYKGYTAGINQLLSIKYKQEPQITIHANILAGFIRGGHLYEAEGFLRKTLPIYQPNERVLGGIKLLLTFVKELSELKGYLSMHSKIYLEFKDYTKSLSESDYDLYKQFNNEIMKLSLQWLQNDKSYGQSSFTAAQTFSSYFDYHQILTLPRTIEEEYISSIKWGRKISEAMKYPIICAQPFHTQLRLTAAAAFPPIQVLFLQGIRQKNLPMTLWCMIISFFISLPEKEAMRLKDILDRSKMRDGFFAISMSKSSPALKGEVEEKASLKRKKG